MKKKIIVTFRVPGFHHWPDAPDHYAYLRDRHRHLFYVTITAVVEHANRAVEIIHFQTKAMKIFMSFGNMPPDIMPGILDFGSQSCEMLAEGMLRELRHDFSVTKVQVMEDGENGAEVSFGG